MMLIPKPIIVYFFNKTSHEKLNERLSEHSHSGIEMEERPSKRSNARNNYNTGLNDSYDEEEIDTMQKKSKYDAYDTQEHQSLKASHTLRASLEGKEPDEFLTLIREGLGQD